MSVISDIEKNNIIAQRFHFSVTITTPQWNLFHKKKLRVVSKNELGSEVD